MLKINVFYGHLFDTVCAEFVLVLDARLKTFGWWFWVLVPIFLLGYHKFAFGLVGLRD